MTDTKTCAECGTEDISPRAITCSVACRQRRYKRHREESLMAGAAGVRAEVGALLRAIDALSPGRLAPLAGFFANTANRYAQDAPGQAEVFHAVARLLAGVRDKNARDFADIARADRAAKRARHGVEPERCEPIYGPLCAEDAALVAREFLTVEAD